MGGALLFNLSIMSVKLGGGGVKGLQVAKEISEKMPCILLGYNT